ncbi:ferritin family protein [Candidatus Cloacimonadota bacterium]
MNFFESAFKLEEQTQTYYKDLAEKCESNEGLKYILKKLVMDHAQHGEKFKQMTDDKCTELKSGDAYESTIKYFQDLQNKQETFSCDIDQVKMYKHAMKLLDKKIDFYSRGLEELDCITNKAVLTEIIKEEKHHRSVLENIIEIVNRPHTWIENAEFTHHENY